ncbi:MAG: protein kinase [Gemmataceae bacterium]|nr:protein kinase [Gemmataceae bacterium]
MASIRSSADRSGGRPLPGASATDVLLDDQSLHWREGRPKTVEEYLDQNPALRSDGERLLDLIYHEVLLRMRRGEAPLVEEYVNRFPELEPQLRDQFDVHQVLAPEGGDAKSTETAPALPVVPGYEVLEELGRGGMGVVYKARQLSLNRLVALKMIRAGRLAGPEDVTRFRSEATAVARLQHPNIVQVHEVGVHEGAPFICLEYVSGGTLSDRLRTAPLPAVPAAQLVETLARAVDHAHHQGIIHRDLKPANILLSGDRNQEAGVRKQGSNASGLTPGSWLLTPDACKITDFGLAKQLETESLQSRTGEMAGTPSYMAPEQARGQMGAIGPATDVYALGAILYEVLTGRPPFKAETLWDTLEQVVTQEPAPPRQLQPRVPRDLETVCLKCLHKDPRRRYATGWELAEDLRRFQAGEPVHARQASVAEQTWKWARRHPTLASVGVTALVLLLAVSAGHYLHLRAALAAALDGQELKTATIEVQAALFKAESAVAAQQWDEAHAHLASVSSRLGGARTKFAADPQLAEFQASADRLERQVAGRLNDLDRLRKLRELRDRAGFYANGFTGLDAAENLERTRAVVRESLQLIDAGAAPDLQATSFTDDEKAEVRQGCFELLVNLADALAESAHRRKNADRSAVAKEALEALDRAARLEPSSGIPPGRRARLLALLGDDAGARSERGRAQPPARAVEHYLAGNDLYREGKLPEAAAQFRQALERESGHYGALYALAVCHLKLRDAHPDTGRTHLALAVARLTRCIDRQPDHVWPYLLRGFALGELDDFAAAEADFARVEASSHIRPDGTAQYGVCVNRGLLRIRQGNLAGAVEDLVRATRLRPSEYAALVNLAQAYQQQKQWAEAQACLDRAVAMKPPLVLASIYRNRARLHEQRKDLAAAVMDLDSAIVHEPLGLQSPAVAGDLFEKGRLLLLQKEHARAVEALDAALALKPDHPLAHRLRAEALLHLGRLPEALGALDHYFAKDLERRRPVAAVYQARGQALAELGKYAEAAEDFTRALELDPDNPVSRAARGWAYHVLDAPRLALTDFERVIRLVPDSADALNGRGFARARLGQYRAGVQDAEAAVRLGVRPDSRSSYHSARIFAQAVLQAELDPALQNPQGRETRLQYQDRAVNLLRQALNALPAPHRAAFWWGTVQADPALAPVRRHAGYRELAETYPRPTKEPFR